MKRRGRALWLAWLCAALAFWFWTGALPPLGAAPATPGDCEIVSVWSNGFHSDLTFAADLLPPDHPLRRYDPGARYLLVGWGDESFFRSSGKDLLLGAEALLPGGPTTVHVIYADQPVERVYIGDQIVPLAISHAGAAALAQRFTDALQLDEQGRVQVIGPGHGGPRSWFLKGRGEFDLFEVCNQWTARALRAAGVNVNAAFLYTGDWLERAVAGQRHVCPAPGKGESA